MGQKNKVIVYKLICAGTIEEKIHKLIDKWLDKKQQDGIHFTKTYAYSDSKNDIPLLEWADIAVCVSPDKALHAHALAQRWAVEDWSI